METEPTVTQAQGRSKAINIGPLAQLGQLYNPEVIGFLRVSALQKLANAFSPEGVYPRIKDLEDGQIQAALRALRTTEPEPGFIFALGEIVSLMNEQGIDALRQEGIEIGVGPLGMLLVDALLSKREGFTAAWRRRVSDSDMAGRFYFRGSDRQIALTTPRELTQEVLESIRQDCEAHCTRRNYGAGIELLPYKHGNRIGFVIIRGSPHRGVAARNSKEQRVALVFRPEKMNVVFYDSTTQLAWISAQGPDVLFFARILGKALFGDERIFSRSISFDLSFGKRSDLRHLLASIGGAEILKILLQNRAFSSPQIGKFNQFATGKEECVLTKYPERDPKIWEFAEVTSLRLWVEPRKDVGPGGAITISENWISIPATLPEELTLKVLHGVGVVAPHGH